MDQNESRSRQMRARESSRVGRLRFRSRTKAITVAAVVVVLAMSVIWPTVAAAVQNSHQFNQSWMILGPYYRKNTGGAPGADSLRLDYLTSRTVTQNSLLPITGSVIYTDCASPYCGSYSFVWNTLAHGYSVPTIFQYTDPDDTINLRGETAGNPDTGVFNQGNDLLGQGDNRLDNTMVYAWAYLNNKTGATTTTYLGVGSNDSIVVNVNGVERLLFNGNRDWGAANEVQTVGGPFTLRTGYNLVMVKVFNGSGAFGFRCRIQGTNQTGVNQAIAIPPSKVSWELVAPGYTYPPRPQAANSATAYRVINNYLNYAAGTPIRVDVGITTASGHPDNVRVREWPPEGWIFGTPATTLGLATVLTTTTARGATSLINWDAALVATNSARMSYWLTPPVGATRDVICTGTVTTDLQRGIGRDRYLFAPSGPVGSFDWTGDIGNPFIGQRLTSQSATLPVWFGPDAILTGDPRHTGKTEFAGGKYTLTAAGGGIQDDRDRCRILAKKVSGDFILRGEIQWTSVSTDASCKAVLMIRNNLGCGSPEAIGGLRNYYDPDTADWPNRFLRTQRSFIAEHRPQHWGGYVGSSGATAVTTESAPGVTMPSRFMLVRRGNQVEAWGMYQGQWIRAAGSPRTVTEMTSQPVLACLAVTSHVSASSATAEFGNVSIAPNPLIYATRSLLSIFPPQNPPFPPGPIYASSAPITVRIFLKNGGTSAALSVQDFVPTSWTVVSASHGGVVDDGSTVTWTLPSFSADTTLTYTIVLPRYVLNVIAPQFFGPGYVDDLTNSLSGLPIGGDNMMFAMNVIVFQQGRFPDTRYAGTQDCELFQWYGGTRNNGWNNEMEEGDNHLGIDDARMPLIRFELSGLSPAMVVQRAELFLFHSRNRAPVGGPNGTSGTVHRVYPARVNRPWSEGRGIGTEGSYANLGEACWNASRAYLSPWTSGGGRGGAFDTDIPKFLALVSSSTVGTWVSWDVTEMAIRWGWSPSSNYGLRLSQDGQNTTHWPVTWPGWPGQRYAAGYCDFYSKDHSNPMQRPMLAVFATYT